MPKKPATIITNITMPWGLFPTPLTSHAWRGTQERTLPGELFVSKPVLSRLHSDQATPGSFPAKVYPDFGFGLPFTWKGLKSSRSVTASFLPHPQVAAKMRKCTQGFWHCLERNQINKTERTCAASEMFWGCRFSPSLESWHCRQSTWHSTLSIEWCEWRMWSPHIAGPTNMPTATGFPAMDCLRSKRFYGPTDYMLHSSLE